MQPGSVVAGRYRIEAELGRGGMGAVYRATHVELGRPVALKVVLPDVLALDEGLARFRREADLAQKLEHPNTVRLYDYGQTEQGLPYIAFELLSGTALDRAITPGGMAETRVVRILTQVLKALMEAHGKGIIHRDIKPPNVFLCDFAGEQDFVKVLDFGIAKSTTARTVLTQAGFGPGTPNYMAPEQVRGDNLTPAADLYALGLMTAEMLSGQLVFSGSVTDVVHAQISPQPVPLPSSLRSSRLWPVLVHATEKDVTRRYRSAGEMLADVESVTRGGTNDAPPTALAARPADPNAHAPTVVGTVLGRSAPPRPSRLPIVIAASVATILAVALILVFSTNSSPRPSEPTATDDDEPGRKKKKQQQKAKKSADDEDDKYDEIPGAPEIKRRMGKLGFKIVSESTTKQPAMTVTTFSGMKDSQMASLYLYDVPDEAVLKSLESSLTAKGSATKRVGSRLYWVFTSPADEPLANDVLDEILR